MTDVTVPPCAITASIAAMAAIFLGLGKPDDQQEPAPPALVDSSVPALAQALVKVAVGVAVAVEDPAAPAARARLAGHRA
jgi:hypothetical protein